MNTQWQLVSRTKNEKTVVPKHGGYAVVMRKCHWCRRFIEAAYACDRCKKKHGWKTGELAEE